MAVSEKTASQKLSELLIKVNESPRDALVLAAILEAKLQTWLLPTAQAWAVDGDGAATNGGGLVGADTVQTEQAAAFAVVVDDPAGTPEISTLAAASALSDFTADYQLFPDTAVAGDYAAFGALVPFCELAFDIGTAANWTAGSIVFEYYTTAGTWATLTIAYDNSGSTGQDGATPLEQDGAILFVPPTDWATTTINGQKAYWIRLTVAVDMTTEPILNSVQHKVVSGGDAFIAPAAGTITAARIADRASTLHTTADVKFIIFNQTTGMHSGELTFAQDKRFDRWADLSLVVNVGDELVVYCTQEDGTNEVTDADLHLTVQVA